MIRLPTLIKFILVTLAFTNSVTLPVGFPLKLYEIAGVMAFGVMLARTRFQFRELGKIPLLWLLFLFLSLFSSAYGLYLLADANITMLEWATGRYHPILNTIFHYSYLVFDIGLLILVYVALRSGQLTHYEFVRFWLIGAFVTVIYAALLNMGTLAGLPAAWLLRWDAVQYMTVSGVRIARCGPFLEGNYLGLYLVISYQIAIWAVIRYHDRFYRWLLPVLVVGVLMSTSPAAIVFTLLLSAYVVFFGGSGRKIRTAFTLGGIAVLLILIQSGLFQILVLHKLSLIFFGDITDPRNVSLVQRLNESYHAWRMFLDHPFGVGMGNYGYLYGNYPDAFTWLTTDFTNFKRIPNNIYLEILCEHGSIVFLLFMYILTLMWFGLQRTGQQLLAFGFVLVGLYFLAFPTFRLALIWAYWGFVVSLGSGQPLRFRNTK